MRYIQVPSPIKVSVNNPDVIRTISLFDLMNETWLNNQAVFGDSIASLRISMKLHNIFEKAKVGDVVAVEDADYAKLKLSVETSSYNPTVARQLLPFIDIVLSASSNDPTTA